MKNITIEPLTICEPDIITTYVGSGIKEKVTYISLNRTFGDNTLEHDIENGAAIYKPLEKYNTTNSSRYTCITAPTLEDGFRAVQYLAGLESILDGFDQDDLDDELLDDSEESLYDEFSENFGKIPLISMDEVVRLDMNKMNTTGFGSFSMEFNGNIKNRIPWWNDCTTESVCIYKKTGYGPSSMFCYSDELLAQDEINCLSRFSDNRHVYVLLISSEIPENDFSISKLILEYTANLFSLSTKKEDIQQYRLKLFDDIFTNSGFQISSKIDKNLLIEKLSSIDENYPCHQYVSTVNYLIHHNAPAVLEPENFQSIGLSKMIDQIKESAKNPLRQNLSGMEQVKSQIENIINTTKLHALRKKRGLTTSGYNNVHLFVGAPGTAKTTVAKIMADMMLEQNLLPGNRFVSVTGAQLKGMYMGQTAHQVHALFESADVIFIDEAYSLTSGNGNCVDLYAEEALAQLAVELEDHATDKLVIFAGYGGDKVSAANNRMSHFLEANPGIKSRINSTVFFDSYSPKEMVTIVHALAKQNDLILGAATDSLIEEYFALRAKESNFGNGREARSFIQQCTRSMAARISTKNPDQLSEKQLSSITKSDVQATIAALQSMNTYQTGKQHRIGLI